MPGHRDAKGNSAFSEQNGQCLISLSSLFTAEAMKQITVFQSVVFVCFLVSNVECTCEDRNYYSEDLSGCVGCPQAKCDDQYPADVQRCKNACGRCCFLVLVFVCSIRQKKLIFCVNQYYVQIILFTKRKHINYSILKIFSLCHIFKL